MSPLVQPFVFWYITVLWFCRPLFTSHYHALYCISFKAHFI